MIFKRRLNHYLKGCFTSEALIEMIPILQFPN